MAELTPKERLQPSLLDRLTDDEPDRDHEPRSRRIMNIRQFRNFVRRDLGWLLNCGHLESTEDLSNYPHVKTSVVNYGIREMSGQAVSGMHADELERMIREAIIAFEPRILPQSIRVVTEVDADEFSRNAINYVVEGQLWAQPVPVQMYLKTKVDMDTGRVDVTES